MRRHVIKSEALDALTAKTEHAERTIGRSFIAFVRTPAEKRRKKDPAGFVFYGTDSFMATYNTPLFNAFVVGSPDEKVKEVRAVIKFFHEQTVESTSPEDVHGAVIVEMLKDYNQAIIEDIDEPRANTAEVFIFDARAHLYWISYAGQHGGQEIRGIGKPVIVRGCYDAETRPRIDETLTRRCRSPRMRKDRLLRVCEDLKQLTRLKTVSYVPIV
ncbi:MAG TPA: hypothetical protein VMU12_02720 [Candidatus Paceibacterota bacterium]|nr:hypothetical protein [Candidatus Paceibacterota bacterium]